MPAIVLTDCFIEIDGVEYSGDATSAAISMSAAVIGDRTPMGEDTKVNVGGVLEWSMAFEFNADEATTGAFFAKLGKEVPVEVRATSGPRSVSNPGYSGNGLITEYTPLKGAHGDYHFVSLTVVSAGPLSRVTTV